MTLTTETLNLWRNNAEITAGETAEDDPEHIAAKAILALTAELLANREAQPVLYASEETLAYAKEGEKNLVTWSEPMGDAVIPLFTVPPAPTSGVVNLPTEFISDEGVVVRLEQVMAALALVGVKYERIGDACRAAMLAQPVSSGYKLPPHLYRELVNSIRDTAVKFSGTEQLRERLNTALSQFIEPDHPHTRTVAPAVPPEIPLTSPVAAEYVAGWNACRAALLAQPVSSGYKLPDGWIACSEQTPVADGAYWCWFGKEKPSVIQQRVCIWIDRNHEWCDSAVTHWMPLPAAPEGGNDHDTGR